MGQATSILDPNNLKNLGTMAGVITVVVVAFYVTGVIRNVKQINKLNEKDSKPLNSAGH